MPKPSLVVRSLPYPILEDGNYSFPEGSYSVSPQIPEGSDTKVILRHSISGAPFVEQLIRDGKAKFACLVSVPKTGFRKLYISNGSEQEVSWDLDIVGEPPLLGPLVLYVGKDLNYVFKKEGDGVAQIWQGKNIEIPKGARLARGRYWRPSSSMQNLLKVIRSDDLTSGSFKVLENTNEGFYFTIHAAPDLFNFLRSSQNDTALRDCIYTHAVSQCFNILKSDYGDSEGESSWREYKSLIALADKLQAEGFPHWSDDNFDGVEVATRLYPISVPALCGNE